MTGGCYGNVIFRVGGKAITPQDRTVQRVSGAGDRIARRWIDLYCVAGVVEGWIKGAGVVPQTVVGMNAAVAKTELELQLRRRLPRVLSEELVHVGPVRRLVAGADLGACTEESHRCLSMATPLCP